MSITKGFVEYRIGAVVKFGGSLLKEPASCRGALDAVSRAAAAGHRLLVVPGGGPTDDTIEALDARHAFSPDTHHHACALAQDQTGLMICDPLWGAATTPCETLESARRALDEGKVAVLLPSKLVFALDPFERTWEITSDAMAVWFSWLVTAARTIVLTNVDGIYAVGKVGEKGALLASITADELETMGHTGVDACVAGYLRRRQMDCWVLHGGHPERLLTLLEGGTPIGTVIRGDE